MTEIFRFYFCFFNERFPIDMTNPLGYTTAFVVEYTAFWYVHCNIACMISLAFGSFLLAITLINTIKRNICAINKDVQFKTHRLQTSKKLVNFIEFHSTLKQLSSFCRFDCFAEMIHCSFQNVVGLSGSFPIFINR